MSARKPVFFITLILTLATQAQVASAQRRAPDAPTPEHFKIEADGRAAIDAARGIFNRGGQDVNIPEAGYFDQVPGFGDSIRHQDYNQATAYFAQFCRNRMLELERVQALAEWKASKGQFAEAYNTLIDGVSTAAHSIDQGFTAQALKDTILLGNLVRDKLNLPTPDGDAPFPDSMKPQAAFHYIDSYVNFVFTTFYQLDAPYWTPWVGCQFCNDRSPWKIREFGSKMAEFAREGLLAVLDSSSIHIGSSGQNASIGQWSYPLLPAGSPQSALAAISIGSRWSAGYLAESGLGPVYSCVIEELWSLAKQIDATGPSFHDQQDALQAFEPWARSVAYHIVEFRPGEGCGGYQRYRDGGPDGPNRYDRQYGGNSGEWGASSAREQREAFESTYSKGGEEKREDQ